MVAFDKSLWDLAYDLELGEESLPLFAAAEREWIDGSINTSSTQDEVTEVVSDSKTHVERYLHRSCMNCGNQEIEESEGIWYHCGRCWYSEWFWLNDDDLWPSPVFAESEIFPEDPNSIWKSLWYFEVNWKIEEVVIDEMESISKNVQKLFVTMGWSKLRITVNNGKITEYYRKTPNKNGRGQWWSWKKRQIVSDTIKSFFEEKLEAKFALS